MRDIPIPDGDAITAIFGIDTDTADPVRDAIADGDPDDASDYGLGYARGAADAWVYCHTVGSAAAADTRTSALPDQGPAPDLHPEPSGLQRTAMPGRDARGLAVLSGNPDPVAVADAVARTICNTPGNAGTDPETLAGIYCDTWAAAYQAASDRLRSLAATDTRNRPGGSRGGAGGAS